VAAAWHAHPMSALVAFRYLPVVLEGLHSTFQPSFT